VPMIAQGELGRIVPPCSEAASASGLGVMYRTVIARLVALPEERGDVTSAPSMCASTLVKVFALEGVDVRWLRHNSCTRARQSRRTARGNIPRTTPHPRLRHPPASHLPQGRQLVAGERPQTCSERRLAPSRTPDPGRR
jgi:hypothetical protein